MIFPNVIIVIFSAMLMTDRYIFPAINVHGEITILLIYFTGSVQMGSPNIRLKRNIY